MGESKIKLVRALPGPSTTGERFERVQRTIKEKLSVLQQQDRTLANNNV